MDCLQKKNTITDVGRRNLEQVVAIVIFVNLIIMALVFVCVLVLVLILVLNWYSTDWSPNKENIEYTTKIK